MLERIRRFADAKIDFAYETTLATKSYAPMLAQFKLEGSSITLIYFYLKSVELAIQRVADRVARGGHSIPEHVIQRRYQRGLQNFFVRYRNIVDSWVLYDNSETTPELIARKGVGLETEVFNADI